MNKKLKICFVSSYIPRECGIATYTDNLMSAIKFSNPSVETVVVAMDDGEKYKYSDSVIAEIAQNDDKFYLKAAKLINNSDIDVVSIQHEFGIFGGFNGNKLLLFLKKLKKPVVMTMHTVPISTEKPYKIIAKRSKSRVKLIKKISAYVSAITVMTELSKEFLVQKLNISEDKIFVVPHGAPTLTEASKQKYLSERRKIGLDKNDFVISSFGLITSRKGLEYVIKALPKIIQDNPNQKIKYLILGRQHPEIPKKYLDYLVSLSKKLKLQNNVIFISRYLSSEEIYCYLINSDIYITPYYSKEQASSGTLSYAIACGKCIISTPYIFAQDVINRHKVGKLVEFKSAKSIAEAVSFLINHPKEMKNFADSSILMGKKIQWPKIGDDFFKIFNKIN